MEPFERPFAVRCSPNFPWCAFADYIKAIDRGWKWRWDDFQPEGVWDHWTPADTAVDGVPTRFIGMGIEHAELSFIGIESVGGTPIPFYECGSYCEGFSGFSLTDLNEFDRLVVSIHNFEQSRRNNTEGEVE